MKYIKNDQLQKLNRIAANNKKNHLADDTPVLTGGYNVPVFRAINGIDQTGWTRCVLPTSPDCEDHILLDVRTKAYEKLDDVPCGKFQWQASNPVPASSDAR